MPYVTTRFVVGGVIVLMALRIALSFADSHTFDVARAGVIGAARIEQGLPLYVYNNHYGDTYGPVNYLMYVPFQHLFPYRFANAGAPAARPATLTFDLLVVLGLFLLGRRLRPGAGGTRLGAGLAYAWTAYPYTSLIIASNTNDALVPLFVVYALLLVHSPPARGALAALGSMAKFAPLPVVPALVTGRGPFRLRPVLVASATFAVLSAALIWAFLPDGGLTEFWKTTLRFQFRRTSPLAIWTREPGLDWLRLASEVVVAALAIGAAFVPRRRTAGQLAALCAAVLAAAQIPANYWIYFYLAWFAPFMFLALFEEYRDLGPEEGGQDRGRVISALLKPVRISRPASVTTTRSSILTPSEPGT
jgi:hypothetical protein